MRKHNLYISFVCEYSAVKQTNREISVQQDLEEEGIDHCITPYRNNKPLIDALMNNPDGLFYMFDDATKNCEENCLYITSNTHVILYLNSSMTKISLNKSCGNENAKVDVCD